MVPFMSLIGRPIEFMTYRDKQWGREVRYTLLTHVKFCFARQATRVLTINQSLLIHQSQAATTIARSSQSSPRMARTKGSCSGVRVTAGAAVGEGEGEGTRVDEGVRG